MGLIRAALGLKMTDEQWRQLENRYGGMAREGDTEQVDGRKRSWGGYKKDRDQLYVSDERER